MGYQLIEHIEVGAGGASSIEFTGIPQDGVDLQVVYSARNTAGSVVAKVQLNGDTTSNYQVRSLYGTGSSAASNATTLTYFQLFSIGQSSYTSNTFANSELYISNYAGSSNKSVSVNGVTENNATASWQNISAAVYLDTTAITSIKLEANSGNFAQNSTASLYKVTAD